MIIGFLGKGGSGKSTLSTAFVRYLAARDERVLAIDGDHNMDLTYNLRGTTDSMDFLGDAGLTNYKDLVLNRATEFRLSPPDPFTSKFSRPLSESPDLSIMAGGPHTDKVMFGQSCSHVLTSALKAYLPLLVLGRTESVVLDEKAGSDGAGTGIVTGLTLAIICVEPTPHSIKAGHQIADLLDFFEVPYEFVMNKAASLVSLRKPPIGVIPFANPTVSENTPDTFGHAVFARIYARGKELESAAPHARFERSKKKFERNREFSQEED